MTPMSVASNQITLNVYEIIKKKVIVPHIRIQEVFSSIRMTDQISPISKIFEIVIDLITNEVVRFFSEKKIFDQNMINMNRNLIRSSGLDNVEITKFKNKI